MKKTEIKHNRSIGKLIGMLSRSAHIYFHHQFKDSTIGHAQVFTLHFLSKHDGISQNELVQHFHMDKSSVTSQLNNLEKNGYIVRIKSAGDGRSRQIFMTDKAKEMSDDLHKVFIGWSQILLEGLSDEEVDKAFELAEHMHNNAKKKIHDIKAQRHEGE